MIPLMYQIPVGRIAYEKKNMWTLDILLLNQLENPVYHPDIESDE